MTKHCLVSVLRNIKLGRWWTHVYWGMYTLIEISFIFSIWFIQVRVTADLEPIPGTLSRQQEYTMKGTKVHHGAPCTNSFTFRGNFKYWTHPTTCMFMRGVRKLEPGRNMSNSFKHLDSTQAQTQTWVAGTVTQKRYPHIRYNQMKIICEGVLHTYIQLILAVPELIFCTFVSWYTDNKLTKILIIISVVSCCACGHYVELEEIHYQFV